MKTSKTRIAVLQRTAALPKARKTASKFFSREDPFGSYTGTCNEKYEQPVQDADDL